MHSFKCWVNRSSSFMRFFLSRDSSIATRYNAATAAQAFGILFLISSVSSILTEKTLLYLRMKHHKMHRISESGNGFDGARRKGLDRYRRCLAPRSGRPSAYHHGVCAARIRICRSVLDIYIHRKTVLKTTRVAPSGLRPSQIIWKHAAMHHTYEPRAVVVLVTGCASIASQLYPRAPQFSPHRDTLAWCIYDVTGRRSRDTVAVIPSTGSASRESTSTPPGRRNPRTSWSRRMPARTA